MGGSHKGPVTVACYLCDKQFSLKSLEMHEKSCRRTAEQQNSKRRQETGEECELADRPHSLTALFQLPDSATYEERAELMETYAHEKRNIVPQGLARCEHCSRTFEHERLIVHQLSCGKQKSATIKATPRKGNKKGGNARPVISRGGWNDCTELNYGPIPSLDDTVEPVTRKPEVAVSSSPRVVVGQGPLKLAPCLYCSREFSVRALPRHEKHCAQTAVVEKESVYHVEERAPQVASRKSPPKKVNMKQPSWDDEIVESATFEDIPQRKETTKPITTAIGGSADAWGDALCVVPKRRM